MQLQESAAAMKKKRSISRKTTRSILLIVAIPIIALWIAAIALYLPPVQRYVTDRLCREISNVSGYDVSIGSLRLTFPLKLRISGFSISRDGMAYLTGEKAEADVSLWPLLTGEIEINYICLENISLETRKMIPDVAISGNIGYFRSTARNIDITKEIADIRQVQLHSTALDITITDTIPDKENDGAPRWIIRVHKGNIKESSVRLHLAKQGVNTAIEIGNLGITDATVDIGNKAYALEKSVLGNSSATYHRHGTTPLDHMEANAIGLECNRFVMTPTNAQIEIGGLHLDQPGGISITDGRVSLHADSCTLNVN